MADNKLIWTELRRTLAQRADVSEKDANAFLSALNAAVIEALKTDKQVKINGLGTFKLQAVAPRRSVNVNTGEEFVIDGYNKVAFVPEAGVRELVESGKLKVESSAEIDPLKKLGEQAEEIVGLLGDLGQSPEPEKKPKAPKKTKKTEEPKPVEPVVEEPKVEEPKVEEPKPVEPVVIPSAPSVVIINEAPKPEKEEKPKKKCHCWRHTLICLVILLLLLLVGYFFFREQLSDFVSEYLKPALAPIEQVEPVNTDTIADVEEAVEVETEAVETPEEEPVAVEEEVPEQRTYDNLITTENMHEASRLAWMAKRFYGDKAYWPYLYDANKDHISNPSVIEVGTPIRVPRLTEAQRDTTSALYQRVKEEAYEAVRRGR
jgi:nucleoid DNA-binding protein